MTAIFVVKGAERIAYLRGMCERQGFLTPGKPVADPKTPNARLTAPDTAQRTDDEQH